MKWLILTFILAISSVSQVLAYDQAKKTKEIYEFSEGPFNFRTGMDSKGTPFEGTVYPRLEISDAFVLFVVHKGTLSGVPSFPSVQKDLDRLTDYFKNSQYPFYFLEDLRTGGVDILEHQYPYNGDYHRIVLGGKNLVLTGANLTECACHAVKSAVLQAVPKKEGPLLNIFIMTDLTADFGWEILPVVTNAKLVSTLTDAMGDEVFMSYLKKYYFSSDKVLCPKFTPPTIEVLNRQFKFKVWRKNKFIGETGDGQEVVNFYFENSQDFINRFHN